MKCKNYYAMSREEIGEAIIAISEWLQKYKGFDGEDRAKFALGIAWNAYQIKLEEDPFLKMVIEQVA